MGKADDRRLGGFLSHERRETSNDQTIGFPGAKKYSDPSVNRWLASQRCRLLSLNRSHPEVAAQSTATNDRALLMSTSQPRLHPPYISTQVILKNSRLSKLRLKVGRGLPISGHIMGTLLLKAEVVPMERLISSQPASTS